MIVTFDVDGVSNISNYDNNNRDEISKLLHGGDVRKQMVEAFKKMCGENPCDNTMGWALEEISNERFFSRVENIQFHPNKTFKNFGVK